MSTLTAGDLFVVQRASKSYKLDAAVLKQSIGAAKISRDPPSPAQQGDLWWSTIEANLFVYYDDGSGSQWVDASPGVDATTFAVYANKVTELEGIIETLQTRLAAIEADHTTMMSSTDTNNGY